jgi:hypothetical protein
MFTLCCMRVCILHSLCTEFDMPSHANAWVLGAPAGAMLLCPKQIIWGNTTGMDTEGNPIAFFDATNEATYTFLDSFIGEMAGLFPDKVRLFFLDILADGSGSGFPYRASTEKDHLQRQARDRGKQN